MALQPRGAAATLADLPVELLSTHILSRLPLDARARCAAVCRHLRRAAGEEVLWRSLSFEGVRCEVSEAVLAGLSRRDGAALRRLDASTQACGMLDVHAVVRAMQAGGAGAAALQELHLGRSGYPSEVRAAFSSEGAFAACALRAACPSLRDLQCCVELRPYAHGTSGWLSDNGTEVPAYKWPVVAGLLAGGAKSVVVWEPDDEVAALLLSAGTVTALKLGVDWEERTTAADVRCLLPLLGDARLTALCMRYRTLTPPAAALLADALRANTTLHALDLDGASIGDVGAAALAQALAENTTLQMLSLGDEWGGEWWA
jgi:hypothetical protein